MSDLSLFEELPLEDSNEEVVLIVGCSVWSGGNKGGAGTSEGYCYPFKMAASVSSFLILYLLDFFFLDLI